MRHELWRSVVGFEGFYEVSNRGRILSVRRGRILAETDRGGYVETSMCVNYKQFHRLVHVLVAAAFVGPCPPGKEVNHKDLNKANNCDWNLEYVTHKRNCAHAIENGNWPDRSANSHPGELHGMSKLTWDAVDEIRRLYGTNSWTHQCLANRFGVTRGAITYVLSENAWRRAA